MGPILWNISHGRFLFSQSFLPFTGSDFIHYSSPRRRRYGMIIFIFERCLRRIRPNSSFPANPYTDLSSSHFPVDSPLRLLVVLFQQNTVKYTGYTRRVLCRKIIIIMRGTRLSVFLQIFTRTLAAIIILEYKKARTYVRPHRMLCLTCGSLCERHIPIPQ